jgi:hypothetical protein
LLLLSTAAGAADCPWAEESSQRSAEAPEQKIARLERIIEDQDNFIALLMENLANCTEENESLAGRQAKETGDDGFVAGEKLRLMDKVRAALHTEESLGFLNALNETQLASLLALIEGVSKTASGDGGEGDSETQAERR